MAERRKAESRKSARRRGRYDLVAELQSSDFGSAWAARDLGSPDPQRIVFVRRVRTKGHVDGPTTRKLKQAARWAQRLAHESILPVLDVLDEDGGELAIVSSYAPATPLRTLLRVASVQRLSGRRRLPIPVPVVLHIALDLLDAIALLERHTAHRSDTPRFVWGGLGPDNVLVGADGRTRLLEPGISGVLRQCQPWAKHPRRVAYAAPEVLMGKAADVRSDLFSIGVILWEMLLNTPLFSGTSAPEIARCVCEDPVVRVDAVRPGGKAISAKLAAVVARALARDPGERFQTADEMADAIWEAGHAIAKTKRTVTVIDELCGEALLRDRKRILQALASADERNPTEPAPDLSQRRRPRRLAPRRPKRRYTSRLPASRAVEPAWSTVPTVEPPAAPRSSSAAPTLRPASPQQPAPPQTRRSQLDTSPVVDRPMARVAVPNPAERALKHTTMRWPPRSFAPSRPLRPPKAAAMHGPAQQFGCAREPQPGVPAAPPSPLPAAQQPAEDFDEDITQRFVRSHLVSAAAALAAQPAATPDTCANSSRAASPPCGGETADTARNGSPCRHSRSGPRSSGTLEPRVSDVAIEELAPDLDRPTAELRRAPSIVERLKRLPLRWAAMSAAAAAACVATWTVLAALPGTHTATTAHAEPPRTVRIDGESTAAAAPPTPRTPQVADEPLTIEGGGPHGPDDAAGGAGADSVPHGTAEVGQRREGENQALRSKRIRRFSGRHYIPTDI